MAMQDIFTDAMNEDTAMIIRKLPEFKAKYMKYAKLDDENFISWTEFWKEVRGENEQREDYDSDGEIIERVS